MTPDREDGREDEETRTPYRSADRIRTSTPINFDLRGKWVQTYNKNPIIARASRETLKTYYIEARDGRRRDGDVKITHEGRQATLSIIQGISKRFPELYKALSMANVRGAWRPIQAARPIEILTLHPKPEITRHVISYLDERDPPRRTLSQS